MDCTALPTYLQAIFILTNCLTKYPGLNMILQVRRAFFPPSFVCLCGFRLPAMHGVELRAWLPANTFAPNVLRLTTRLPTAALRRCRT